MTMAIVANGRFLGGEFMVASNADVSDKLLKIVVRKDSGSIKMLDELVSMKTGNDLDDGDIRYTQAKKIRIRSKERCNSYHSW